MPLLAIGPWIPKGLIVHGNESWLRRPEPDSQLEHSSLLATTRELLGVNQKPLTNRDAWATSFAGIVSLLGEARNDVPLTAPAPLASRTPSEEMQQPVNDLQLDLLGMHAMLSQAHSTHPKRQEHVHDALRQHHRRIVDRLASLESRFGVAVVPVNSAPMNKIEGHFHVDVSSGRIRTRTLNVHGIYYCLTALSNGTTLGLSLCKNQSLTQLFTFDGSVGSIIHGETCAEVNRISGVPPPGDFGSSYSLNLKPCRNNNIYQSFSYYASWDGDDDIINWGDGAGYLVVVPN